MYIAEDKILKGAQASFIDSDIKTDTRYKQEFLYNDYKCGRKVLSSIEDELRNCDSFFFSVAFITMGGVTPLLQTMSELEKRNIHGRILTTDYQNFSEPAAIKKLNSLSNIEIKMYSVENTDHDFHTKGYVFNRGDEYRCIVGSSNLTGNALSKNQEWNTKIVSTERGEFAQDLVGEFEKLWASEHALDFEDFIDKYEANYNIIKKQRKLATQQKLVAIEDYQLKPNSMQVDFVNNISKLIEDKENKALLISATGTGKTYASAFAVREIDPQRALFIVHREQIAKQAMKSYGRVFQGTRTFGLVSGSSREFDRDFVFATMQMMSKENIQEIFGKDEFDTIIIDEAHRTGANSYKKIMDYFTPKFWLGMTASPDRMDGFDVYDLFDHNIACEIRLQQALEEDLLCPFHYFGITDIYFDNDEVINTGDLRDFNRIVSEDRVDYIIEKIEYYGYSGERVKGLIFCETVREAKSLSEKFNERGYRTIALSGEDDQQSRQGAVERLAKDDGPDCIDYIFTVDIFNEGVDVPEIN